MMRNPTRPLRSYPLYDAIVAEAKAARHSVNSAVTILLEEALGARGKWKPPSGADVPFWKRGKPKEASK
jgi:hypothetical protein